MQGNCSRSESLQNVWKEKEKFAKEKDRSGKSVGTTVTGSRHDLSDRRSLYRASLSRGR